MRMYDKAGRSRWPLVIGIAVVLVAAVIFFVVEALPGGAPIAGPAGTVTATPTPTSTAEGGSTGAGDGEDEVAPTGCLGGLDRNADMVIAAQKAAKHTSYGAVETAAAMYRWMWQFPHPSADSADKVSNAIMAKGAKPSFRDLAASLENLPDMTVGQVPQGAEFHVSTINGLWSVDEASSSDGVAVNLAVGYVINGELSPTKAAVITLNMVWENDAWHLLSGGTPDQAKLAAGGNRFTGGC